MTDNDDVLVPSKETAALVRSSLDKVIKGEISFTDLVAVISTPEPIEIVSKAPPKALSLSTEVLAALEALPGVFGKIKVDKDRALTKPEIVALVEEHKTITTLLDVLEKRKTESLREIFANHLDHVLDDEVSKDPRGKRTDTKGHTAPYETQNLEVDGTDRKIQRFTGGGKPVLSTADIEKLLADEKITRAQYLAITSKPESPRVMDVPKMSKACKADPGLFFVLAGAARTSNITTTLKVVKA